MKKIADGISNVLSDNEFISKDDVAACSYGLEIMLSSLLEILSIIFISIFVGNLLETILFFASFIPLRLFAGGYHADTKLRCYLVSLFVYFAFTMAMALTPSNTYTLIAFVCSAFTMLAVLLKAPIIHNNKSVNSNEKIHYRKFSVSISIAEIAVTLLLIVVFPDGKSAVSVGFGQLAVSLSMLSAIIKEQICTKRK